MARIIGGDQYRWRYSERHGHQDFADFADRICGICEILIHFRQKDNDSEGSAPHHEKKNMNTPDPQLEALKQEAAAQEQLQEKPGRNEPCYCGSGKKYKACHMAADRAAEEERRQGPIAADFLRRDLLKFARDERFHAAFATALPHYWMGYYDVDNAEEMSLAESTRFFDWFAFDYVLENNVTGTDRLVEVYQAERSAALSRHQQAVLVQWMATMPASAYELLDYEGQRLYLRDILTQEAYTVYEAGGHGATEVGDVLLIRLVPVNDRLEFSTSAAYIPQDEVADLSQKLADALQEYRADHPEADAAAFLRRYGHLPIHHALEQAVLKGRPAVDRLNPEREEALAEKAARRLRSLQRRR